VPGGTGEAFDWSLIPQQLSKPIILAGGLTPDNVAEAVARSAVCGGCQRRGRASKGIKDHAKIRAFMQPYAAAAR
jgi:phosphoribosylanthranilate isomerase